MSDVLASSENKDPAASKKQGGTLRRGIKALTGKLGRKNSGNSATLSLANKDPRNFGSSGDLDENSGQPTLLSARQSPSISRSISVQDNYSQNDRQFHKAEPNSAKKHPIEAEQMIAPHNPPPPIPVLNGAVFPKRTQVGTASDFFPTNGINKTPLNGMAKQNGAPQSPSANPILPAANLSQKVLPPKTEKEKPVLLNDQKEIVELPKYQKIKLNGYVGFASLPYQVVRRSQQRGFQFNLLCVGETGTGKTTLIESLFGIKLSDFEPCNNELNTVELRSKQCEINDSNVNVKLRLVETAGFGDQLDKEKSAKVIVDFINAQFEARLKEELMVKRCLSHNEDKRIHACLYFISPTGHGLKALDIVTMKELSKRVNVIPVIAKSDTTSKDELTRFKIKILSELRNHKIEIYQFPIDDEAVAEQNRKMNSFVPFAVVGSVDFVTKEDGSVVRARNYPWGVVEVENKDHCDFIYLREAILRTNVDALRERTQNVLYESYRRDRLRELKMGDGDCGPNMEKACELRQREFQDELQKRDKKFNESFVQRVDEKEMELKRRDELINMRRDEIDKNYQNELRVLEQKLVYANEEKARFIDGRGSDRFHSKKSKK